MKKLAKIRIGSHMFGLNTEQSDEDFVEIVKYDLDDLIGLEYEGEIQFSKDHKAYEIGKLFELLLKNNPNMLELIYAPQNCIIETSPEWELIRKNKKKFLSKLCRNTYGEYGASQIKKAKGYNKFANWETHRVTRKDVLDFCYISVGHGHTKELKSWLDDRKYSQEDCGLSKLSNMHNCYALFYDTLADRRTSMFNGIVKDLDKSNDITLSSIPKEADWLRYLGVISFNKEGYSTHCKDYNSYQTWLKNRNEDRFQTNKEHGQEYDSKNISHCYRLLKVANEIAVHNEIFVDRSLIDKEILMRIKKGEENLSDIVTDIENLKENLGYWYAHSDLPETPDKEFVNKLLIQIRKM